MTCSCGESLSALSGKYDHSGSSPGARSGTGSAFRSCHPDHRATGEIALSAIYPDAGNPFAHRPLREDVGLDAWTVREAWLINSPQVSHYVDVTDTFERKVDAGRLHHSQMGNRQDLAAELRERIVANTAAAQLPADRLTEAFQVVVTG